MRKHGSCKAIIPDDMLEEVAAHDGPATVHFIGGEEVYNRPEELPAKLVQALEHFARCERCKARAMVHPLLHPS